jgi:hypothetical protein
MRILLLLLGRAVASSRAGCTKRYPAKKPPAAPAPAKVPVLNVSSLGTPSGLISPPPSPANSDTLPFNLPLGKGYGIEGSWSGPNQVKGTTRFERIGDFSVRKADNADVDPKEIADVLEKWIAASGVQATQSSGAGGLQRTIEYGTAQTLGSVGYTIRPDAPAKDVSFHLEVREQPRQSSR